MENRCLVPAQLRHYRAVLEAASRSRGTIDQYMRALRTFARWLDGAPVSQQRVSRWADALLEEGYAPITVNAMLAALNGFFRWQGWEDCRCRYLRVQRRLFRPAERDLSRDDYARLVRAAHRTGNHRLALLMEAICGTGIRVSEVKALTVEAAKQGRADIHLKGKIRTILIPSKLCQKLLRYARAHKIAAGEIFLASNGASLSRCRIWLEMKRLAKAANVAPSKVFPHNLRHLFATVYYQTYKDLSRLADVLGHSSIETTRIYLVTSGSECLHQLDRLQLVL
ncbi:MAG: tyrosine-type recombinase/integrase [Peptococcaceae bacterium]|nr:tyrosine-type recombinase/integrase [Peptococcaceae bacterium]